MLVSEDFKVLCFQSHRYLGAASQHCVLDGGLKIDLEWVAELVWFGISQKVSIGAASVHLVVAHAVFLQVREDFFQRLLTDAADAPCG